MQVYLYLIRLEWRRMFTYRFEFWAELIFGILLKCTVVYFLWSTLYETLDSPLLKGIPFKYMLAYVLLSVSMKDMIIGKTVGILSDDIYQGSLNKYLIYPSSFVFQKLAAHLARTLFHFLQIPCFFIFLSFFFDHSLSWQRLALAFLPIILGACLYFMMNAILELSAFKWDSVWSLSVGLRFVSNFLGGISVPLALFPEEYRSLLIWTPFYYCAGYPLEILTGISNNPDQPISMELSSMLFQSLGQGTFFALIWFIFFSLMFHLVYLRCLRSYSGIGI